MIVVGRENEKRECRMIFAKSLIRIDSRSKNMPPFLFFFYIFTMKNMYKVDKK